MLHHAHHVSRSAHKLRVIAFAHLCELHRAAHSETQLQCAASVAAEWSPLECAFRIGFTSGYICAQYMMLHLHCLGHPVAAC